MNTKKNKMMKILIVITLLFFIIMIATQSFAADAGAFNPSEVKGKTSVKGQTEIKVLGQNIVGILQVAGVVISVIVLLILGIKYMMGSAEEKADYKKSMIPYLVGALVLFGATTIANVVYQFAINLQSTT